MSLKEIKNKIGSIGNTQKITKAMEMVAASKLRYAQDRMKSSEPYFEAIGKIISEFLETNAGLQHPYLNKNASKKDLYIVVSSDRGLCGGLNQNLFKKILLQINSSSNEVAIATIGNKSNQFFRKMGLSILVEKNDIGDAPQLEDFLTFMEQILELYKSAQVGRIFFCYNHFVNTMKYEPSSLQVLPITSVQKKSELATKVDAPYYLYESEPDLILDVLLNRFIEHSFYFSLVSNVACEHSARMIAMKSATDNAFELKEKLQLSYNKQRQAGITQELSEICAGSSI